MASQSTRHPELEERFRLHSVALKGQNLGTAGIYQATFPNIPLELQVLYANRLQEMEAHFGDNIGGLVGFIDSTQDTLTGLTKSDIERQGHLLSNTSGLELSLADSWRIDLRKYTDEILRGDFTHKQEVIDIFKSNSLLFSSFAGGQELPIGQGLAVLEAYHTIRRLQAAGKNTQELGIIDYTSGTVLRYDDVKRQADAVRNFFDTAVKNILELSTGTVIDSAFLENKSIFARFHTHPLDDCNYFPSIEDKANTHIAGPNVLFSQTGNVLRAYAINRGESKLVYEAKLK